MLKFLQDKSPSGLLFSVSYPDANKTTHIHIPMRLSASPLFAPHVEKLTNALGSFIKRAPGVIEILSKKGWGQAAKKELSEIISAAKSLQKTAIDRKIELENKRAAMLIPRKPLDPERAAEIRVWAQNQKSAELVGYALKDANIAAALLDFRALSGLSNDLLAHIEDALIKHNWAGLYAPQSPLKPSFENILASGFDMETANRLAEEAVANHAQALVEVKEVETVLRTTVDFYAVAADVSRQEAFVSLGLGG